MAVVEQTIVGVTEAGWYDDPSCEHNLRYFDGRSWTNHVTHNGPTPCSGCRAAEEDD